MRMSVNTRYIVGIGVPKKRNEHNYGLGTLLFSLKPSIAIMNGSTEHVVAASIVCDPCAPPLPLGWISPQLQPTIIESYGLQLIL